MEMTMEQVMVVMTTMAQNIEKLNAKIDTLQTKGKAKDTAVVVEGTLIEGSKDQYVEGTNREDLHEQIAKYYGKSGKIAKVVIEKAMIEPNSRLLRAVVQKHFVDGSVWGTHFRAYDLGKQKQL